MEYNDLITSFINPPPPSLDGLIWRSITRDDLTELVELAGMCYLSDGGLHFLFEPDEIISQFFPDEPGAAIGALNADGQLVACNAISLSGNSRSLRATIVGYVRPDMRRRGFGAYLMRWSQVQAESLLDGAAADQRVLQICTESLTETASRLYGAHGFKPVMEELVMRRDPGMPLPDRALPPDVTITSWQPDLADPFFQAYDSAFRERPGFPGYRSAAEWVDSWTDDHFRPEWSLLARTGDVPLGFLTGTSNPPHGYVMQVGVIPTMRRRGLASGLIVEAMRRMRAAGAASVWITVHINNPGAIQAYSQLGFTTIGRRARYERITELHKGDSDMEAAHRDELIKTLKDRFTKNMRRHTGIDWSSVQAKLEASPEKLQALYEMERTGGEPDVVGRDDETGEFIFCDCSPESPAGRRSICYDRESLDSRKENKPSGNAIEMASLMGIEVLTELQYRDLQELGEFDKKTSSWVQTPAKIRDLGGALFCDRRYDHIFVYHNGAESYYAARGFRGRLKV